MRNVLLFILCCFCTQISRGQTAWNWTPLADMPFKTSNNAVSHGNMSGNTYIFSFGGIDTTKIWSGIHKRSFRYDVTNDIWDEIDTLPVALPLIASSANTVKNKIYIIGGYHVYSSGNETSSDEVIIYDPETNSYEPNGTPIPVAIDDQAQVVWRDSLIFVISGWSNSTNVPNVQIYDPALDQWQVGTEVPNTNDYKVFGSSGQIIGDTIYYYGGASLGWNFPARPELRKGVIDPNNPTNITWTLMDDAPQANYRSACVSHSNDIFWIGGSTTSYNYNGIAYNGSGGVEPTFGIMRYESYWNDWYEGTGSPYGVMDLRGYGQVSSTSWIICGGIESGQSVSDKTYLLSYDPIVGEVSENAGSNFIVNGHSISFSEKVEHIELLTLDGRIAQSNIKSFIDPKLNGVFILSYTHEGTIYRKQVLIQ